MHLTQLQPEYNKQTNHKYLWTYLGERGETDLNNATYEYVIALVVDPVFQHHFVHHGDEDLVLEEREEKGKQSK